MQSLIKLNFNCNFFALPKVTRAILKILSTFSALFINLYLLAPLQASSTDSYVQYSVGLIHQQIRIVILMNLDKTLKSQMQVSAQPINPQLQSTQSTSFGGQHSNAGETSQAPSIDRILYRVLAKPENKHLLQRIIAGTNNTEEEWLNVFMQIVTLYERGRNLFQFEQMFKMPLTVII
ncbi:hypothetical protein FGO68_gene12037 [Halteria grandinella]|uniref:Uncharacterized protein n=1 Tax=Halteria grandinella TaxID=5974 RepID=A0A8J8SYB0_HALGN|nr:hypothetical protein FGO68_gene12037 [Halteria grandinella]